MRICDVAKREKAREEKAQTSSKTSGKLLVQNSQHLAPNVAGSLVKDALRLRLRSLSHRRDYEKGRRKCSKARNHIVKLVKTVQNDVYFYLTRMSKTSLFTYTSCFFVSVLLYICFCYVHNPCPCDSFCLFNVKCSMLTFLNIVLASCPIAALPRTSRSHHTDLAPKSKLLRWTSAAFRLRVTRNCGILFKPFHHR